MLNINKWLQGKLNNREIKVFTKILSLPKEVRGKAQSLQDRAKKIEELDSNNNLLTTILALILLIVLLATPDGRILIVEHIELAGYMFIAFAACCLILGWVLVNYILYIIFYKSRINGIKQDIKEVTADESYASALAELLKIDTVLAKKLKKYSLP
ncbi:MAG: hypothetical protein Q7R92_01670 [bacterium]|nr:hypothetical protein [bacterium]